MALSTRQMLRRVDVELAQYNATGNLKYDQAERFIDMVVETPTILSQARVVRMNAPRVQISKIGFANRIMRAARQPMGAQDDGSHTRHLAAADRVAPDTESMELVSKEIMAEIHIPYEVLEDNIEGQSLESHIMRLIATRAAEDLEEWALRADTVSGDAYLALNDGLLKTAVSNVVDVAAAGPNPDMFASGMLAMPQRFLRNYNALKHWVTVQDTIRYRNLVGQRLTGYGDSVLTQNGELFVHGIQVLAAPLMSANIGLFTFPENMLFGIQRQISIETDKDIRARTIIIVLTARVDVKWEDENATVKYINVN